MTITGATFRAFLLGCTLAVAAAPVQAREAKDSSSKEDAPRQKSRTADGARTSITPYLEVSQAVFAELSPGSDVLTYTNLAAGVDAEIAGRNTQGAVSLRYERRIGWGKNDPDGDVISGLARVASQIVPGTLQIDAGALAARTTTSVWPTIEASSAAGEAASTGGESKMIRRLGDCSESRSSTCAARLAARNSVSELVVRPAGST